MCYLLKCGGFGFLGNRYFKKQTPTTTTTTLGLMVTCIFPPPHPKLVTEPHSLETVVIHNIFLQKKTYYTLRLSKLDENKSLGCVTVPNTAALKCENTRTLGNSSLSLAFPFHFILSDGSSL